MSSRHTGRYQTAATARPFPVGVGLRGALRDGYRFSNLRRDMAAGLVVGVVALPLSMALAIAAGVPPQHGLYTAIVAGGLIAATGGSRLNVSGPTAAFVILLAPISAKYGVAGLALASLMAGGFLLIMGLARLGRLIQFVPYPVTTGFTAGIAVVIATLQLKDLLGLEVLSSGSHYWERVSGLWQALPSLNWADAAVGAFTLAVLLAWPRVSKRVPGPLVAIALAALCAWALAELAGVHAATIAGRFSYIKDGVTRAGIPQLPPLPTLPWLLPGADGAPFVLSWSVIRDLLPSALAISALGAIESLLSAVVSDGMAGTRHDPDAELVGQGIGNLAAPFFGGFAATGAIARTATSVRNGGRSPVAAISHALFVLAAVLLLAPVLGYLPMAAMAALLLVVAWNMSEARHVAHMLRVSPRSDVIVLVTCFALTIMFDMVVAVGVGVVLASLLFMRRMAEISGTSMVNGGSGEQSVALPPGVLLYRIAGPLFFGAADKAISAITTTGSAQVLMLEMQAVPAMDATGLVALESLLKKLEGAGVLVQIIGLQPQPRSVLRKAGVEERPGVLTFHPTLESALLISRLVP